MNITGAQEGVSFPGPADWFTGAVWIDVIARDLEASRLRASRVAFSAGARTAWHSHPLGQTLHILSGIARVQCASGELREAGPGAIVTFAPGELHWHGARPDQPMIHLALQEADEDGTEVEWGAKVTDSEYAGQ